MDGKDERDDTAGLCEEIAGLARKYLEDPDCDGIEEIEKIILTAVGESRWDDVSKWHRVRLRYLRFQQQRAGLARVITPGESVAAPG